MAVRATPGSTTALMRWPTSCHTPAARRSQVKPIWLTPTCSPRSSSNSFSNSTGCKSQNSVGKFSTGIWGGKPSEKRGFRPGTARRIIRISPTESWDLHRVMAANRQLYGLEKLPHSLRPKLEMPFKASRRHQYWSCDVRYIEEHLLPDPRPVYVITIFENFSRMVLSSKISATQNQWDYLSVLADALRRYGAPEAIVTDGGTIFTCTQAMQLYDMLGIRKERIDPGEPWENYAETLFSIQRRLADHAFSNARTWPEIQQAHQTWWNNYNSEHHYAHRERQDGRHSEDGSAAWDVGAQHSRRGAFTGLV